MRNTDADWEVFANRDPYWAVITKDEFRREYMDQGAREAFFANGEGTIAHTVGILGKHFGCPDRFDAALDFGCGVGRLLIPLARRSRIAIGVDVSPTMLGECQRNASQFGIQNAILRQSDDSLSRVREYIGKVNLLTSLLVFQHIPPSRGILILGGLLDLLSPASFGCIQLLTGSQLANQTSNSVEPIMEMNPYDLNLVISVLNRNGIKDILFRLEGHDAAIATTIYFRR